jgi:hypothetical protein
MHFDPIMNETLDDQQTDATRADHGNALARSNKRPGNGSNRGDDGAGHQPGFGQADSGGTRKRLSARTLKNSANPPFLVTPRMD